MQEFNMITYRQIKTIFLALLFCLGVNISYIQNANAQAQDQIAQNASFNGGIINEIIIDGTERIEPSTVLSYLTVQPGDAWDSTRINRSIRSLFATGLFADIALERDVNNLIVRIVENPIINRISFEGNDKIESDDLRSEVRLRPRVVYTRTRVQEDVARILELYRRSGRFSAEVEPKVIQLEQNRVDLIFEINEGSSSHIRRINFIGNEAFSDDRLREVIRSREERWYRFLTSDDTYDPDRLAYDGELLRRYYLDEGYADFQVESSVAELSDNREDFFVTLTITEGARYKFGNVSIETEFARLDEAELLPLLTIQKDDWYDAGNVTDSIDAITNYLAEQQYAFVDIEPLLARDLETQTIDVILQVNEGIRVYVERVNIIGNDHTRDEVIRREMLIVEGDPFSRDRLQRSEARIRDLGFFSNVTINTAEGSDADRVIVTITVEEQNTGDLSIGGGYSTTDGPVGDFSIRENNLLGRGQKLSFSTTISGRRTKFNISFTEPYFLGRHVSAGFDLFNTDLDFQDEASYDEVKTGFGLRFGYQLGPNLIQNLRYRFEYNDIRNVGSTASLAVIQAAGSSITSEVSQTLLYNQLDSRQTPTEGYQLNFTTDIAGLGGDVRYLRGKFSADYFHPFFERSVILRLSTEGGIIVGIGDDVEINDRFFLGGESLRGFRVAGVGPRDGTTDDSLGGDHYIRTLAEVGFPLGLPEELGLRGFVWSDIGYIGAFNDIDAVTNLLDSSTPRAAIGTGFSWRSPMGPIRFDFALPILEESYDETETFRFSFGTRF